MRGAPLCAAVLALCALAACGKKGPPLAPLRYVPGPVTDLQARRSGNEVRLHFILPTTNLQKQGPLQLDRIEIFAVTVAAAAQKTPALTRRIYVVRGLTPGGRAGQPSGRVMLPIVDMPSPPAAVAVKYDEKAITISWTAEVPALGQPPTAFNVYRAGETAPLNPKPLSTTTFVRPGVSFGTEECFVVRTAAATANVTLESPPTDQQCVTPRDVFPPATPTGLSAVGTSGAINLIWEANTDADLAGYIVLRGEAPGDTLQAITTTPIQRTTYQDTTVKPDVRYVYAVVAVDRAAPPNMSSQSARVEESAR